MANGDKQPTRGGDILAKKDSHAEIASKLSVDKSLVTRWISGARKPTTAHREKLEALYGIPIDAEWGEPPKPPSTPSIEPPATVVPSRRQAAEPPATEDNNERLQRHIREGLDDLDGDEELSGVKRAEALKKLVDAQVSLDKSTGDNALTMTRIAAHPEFQRVVRLITDVVAADPVMLGKVIEILRANP